MHFSGYDFTEIIPVTFPYGQNTLTNNNKCAEFLAIAFNNTNLSYHSQG